MVSDTLSLDDTVLQVQDLVYNQPLTCSEILKNFWASSVSPLIITWSLKVNAFRWCFYSEWVKEELNSWVGLNFLHCNIEATRCRASASCNQDAQESQRKETNDGYCLCNHSRVLGELHQGLIVLKWQTASGMTWMKNNYIQLHSGCCGSDEQASWTFSTSWRNFLQRQIAFHRHGTLALQLPAQWVDMTAIFWLKGRMYSHAWLSVNTGCCLVWQQ